jgi:hypothetical protein
MSPANYMRGTRLWFLEFGKCTFKAAETGEGGAFIYAKSKASDIDGAMKVAPANFRKAAKEGTRLLHLDQCSDRGMNLGLRNGV